MNAHRSLDESPELLATPPLETGPAPAPAPAPAAAPAGPRLPAKSPTWAGILSLMPGLGQVYVGYYQRGFTHLLIAAATITALSSRPVGLEPLLGVFLAFFWLYNVIDAIRLATLYNLAVQNQRSTLDLQGVKLPAQSGSLAGGLVLVAAGILLLLHTRFDVSLDWMREWWPAGVIILGVWLAVQSRRSSR